jgi:hypothetical protein
LSLLLTYEDNSLQALNTEVSLLQTRLNSIQRKSLEESFNDLFTLTTRPKSSFHDDNNANLLIEEIPLSEVLPASLLSLSNDSNLFSNPQNIRTK